MRRIQGEIKLPECATSEYISALLFPSFWEVPPPTKDLE